MSDLFFKNKGDLFTGYRTNSAMREHCSRPGQTDENGNILYVTEQSHKDLCDLNRIIKKYHRTGLVDHVSKIEAQYGDVTGDDYKSALDKIVGAKNLFDGLPSHIRNRFKNSPEEFLRFFENPNNRQEGIDLGLIRGEWTPETDGFGEHIKTKSERKKVKEKVTEPVSTEE